MDTLDASFHATSLSSALFNSMLTAPYKCLVRLASSGSIHVSTHRCKQNPVSIHEIIIIILSSYVIVTSFIIKTGLLGWWELSMWWFSTSSYLQWSSHMQGARHLDRLHRILTFRKAANIFKVFETLYFKSFFPPTPTHPQHSLTPSPSLQGSVYRPRSGSSAKDQPRLLRPQLRPQNHQGCYRCYCCCHCLLWHVFVACCCMFWHVFVACCCMLWHVYVACCCMLWHVFVACCCILWHVFVACCCMLWHVFVACCCMLWHVFVACCCMLWHVFVACCCML